MLRRECLAWAAPALGLAAAPPPISVGCQTNAWKFNSAEYAASVVLWNTIRDLGFAGIETSFRNVEPHFERGGEVAAQLRRMGLRLFGVHIWLEKYDPVTAIAPFDLIERVATGSAKIGAERLILSGHVAEKFEDKLAGLMRAEALCRKLGLRIGYHNHGPELMGADPELPRLMKRTRGIEYVVDLGWASRAKTDLVALFRKHQNQIGAFHFRDFKGEQQVPLGQGDVDYAPLAKAILRARWSGWVLAEEERADGSKPGETAAGPARAHLRKLFGV